MQLQKNISLPIHTFSIKFSILITGIYSCHILRGNNAEVLTGLRACYFQIFCKLLWHHKAVSISVDIIKQIL